MTVLLRATLAFMLVLFVGWPVTADAQNKAKKEPTAAQMAARERQQKCSAEWKEAKAGGKLAADARWPKFWSECNARLKGKNV